MKKNFPIIIPAVAGTVLIGIVTFAISRVNITEHSQLVESCWRRGQYGKHYQPTREEVDTWIKEIEKHDTIIKDTLLFCAMIDYESSWNPTNRSPKGARGLFQIMPDTAREYCRKRKIKYGVNIERALYNPTFNIMVGVGIYTEIYQKWNYEEHLLPMAIWNSGCGNIGRWIENGNRIRGTFWKDIQESKKQIEAARSRILKRKEGER